MEGAFVFKSETLPEDPLKGMEAIRDYLGKVVACGFVDPPAWWLEDQAFYATRYSRTARLPDSLFVLAIEPLGWAYDTDHESFLWNRLQNCEHIYWLEYKDEAGKPKYRGSVFADVRNAFAKLGHVITSSNDCQKLVGHNFQFAVVNKRYSKMQTSDTQLHLPVEQRDDYSFSGVKRVLVRPKPKTDLPPSEQVSPDEEAAGLQVVATALDGKGPEDFFGVVTKLPLNGTFKTTIVDEAVNDDGVKLITRLMRANLMKFEDGRLQLSQS